MIVLNKGQGDAHLAGVALLLPGFHKIAAFVAPDLGFDQKDAFQRGTFYVHDIPRGRMLSGSRRDCRKAMLFRIPANYPRAARSRRARVSSLPRNAMISGR